MEYCTAECASAMDVVRHDRAGDLLLLEALEALGLQDKVSFIRNNVDHYTGATFGCHENYSLDRAVPREEKEGLSLLAFLTLRILFTGSGRVGSGRANLLANQGANGKQNVAFQISQRADFIVNDCFEWVQHNRSIINMRDEPLADGRRYRRLHLIHGDTNVLPSALFLKVGTTRLVLDLLEAKAMPAIALADPVTSLRALSRIWRAPWRVLLADGSKADALSLLWLYQQRAKQLFAGRDRETDAVLELWNRVLNALATDPLSLVGIVDWVSKQHLLGEFCAREGLEWGHPWLESQDLEYHQIDPRRSLGLAMANTDGFWNPLRLDQAKRCPPSNSRAHARSRLMREIQDTADSTYYVDWAEVAGPNARRAVLANPFQA
jgi:proteasome accessory factor A